MKKKVFISVAVVLLLVMVTVMCVACTPSLSSVTSKYKKEGYTSSSTTIDGNTGAIFSKGLLAVTVVWFDNKDDAQSYYDGMVKTLGEDLVVKKGNAVASSLSKEALAIF